jgi:hypothetical protein
LCLNLVLCGQPLARLLEDRPLVERIDLAQREQLNPLLAHRLDHRLQRRGLIRRGAKAQHRLHAHRRS